MQVSLNEIISNNKIIDIRTSLDFNECNYPGSINVPRINLLNDPSLYINKNERVYIICSKGIISLSCAKVLNALGYNCFSVKGGIETYKDEKK